jgi:PKD repeat protein
MRERPRRAPVAERHQLQLARIKEGIMMNGRNAPRRRTAKAVAASLLAGVSALALAAGPALAAPPTADFTFSPASPRADATTHQGDPVSFSSSSSPALGGTIDSQSWDFGDGGSGSGASPSHTYTTPGAKTVKLTVAGTQPPNAQESAVATKTVTVAANQPPVARIKVTPAIPTVGTAATFSSTGSTDADGTIASQSWDLDNNGTFGDATTKTAKRTFTTAGTFVVGLQVTDDLGRTATTTLSVRINAPPTASIGPTSPAKPIAGDTVNFKSTSTDADGTITATAWDLDHDGLFNDATGVVAQRTFATAGTYTVGVLVTDDTGATNATTTTITVVPNQAPNAAFSYTPASPTAGQQVTFTSSSKDPDGSISSTTWDTDGDGQFNDARGPSARRTFAQPGSYTVSVRVTDDRGATDTAFEIISVVSAAGNFTSGSGTPTVIAPKDSKLRLLSPFPVVTLRGRLVRGGARIDGLTVSQLPKGARVEVRCSHKGCPFRSKVRRPRGRSRSVRFPELNRRLRGGIVLKVIVTEAGRIGKYTSFKIRKSGAPSRKDLCMVPGVNRPRGCTTK